MLRRCFEEAAARPDDGVEGHDELFTQRINRWVRHLGKELLEVHVERPRAWREHGQRNVIPHRKDRLFPVGGHGLQHHLEFFIAVAEGHLLLEEAFRIPGGPVGLRLRRQTMQRHEVLLEPLSVRLALRVTVFDFIVEQEPAVDGIHRQHLARPEPTFLHDGGLIQAMQDADFRGHNDEPVVGDMIAGGSQAVTIQDRTDERAVAERDRCWPIPWLGQARVVAEELRDRRIHVRHLLPRLGD